MSLELCRIVLVETHYPGNIGAAARAMCNMGLRKLFLVRPVADVQDRKARQLATHGEFIVKDAKIVQDFGAAVAECALVLGTTARTGGPFRRQNIGAPREILPHAVDVLRQRQPVALVFGPEPNGLENDIVTRCHHMIEIPTDEGYSSLNVAQAVAICLYELRVHWLQHREGVAASSDELATHSEQEQMFANLQAALAEQHFLFGDKADALMHAVRHLLGKAKLTTKEVQILMGLARQMRWFAAKGPRTP